MTFTLDNHEFELVSFVRTIIHGDLGIERLHEPGFNHQEVWQAIASAGWLHVGGACGDRAGPVTEHIEFAHTGDPQDRHRNLTMLMVPIDQPEATGRPLHQLDGEAEFNHVYSHDATTSVDNVGDVHGGWSWL